MKTVDKKSYNKKLSIFGAVFTLLLASFAPFFGVRAINNPENYAQVRMRGATDIVVTSTNITAGYNGGEVSVTGATDPVYEIIDNWDYGGGQTGDMHTLYTKSSSLTFTAHPNENKRAEARINGQLLNLTDNSYTMEDLLKQGEVDGQYDGYEIEFSFIDDNSQQPPIPEEGPAAEVHLNCADNTTNCLQDVGFGINNGLTAGADPSHPSDAIIYHYNGEDEDTTIKLRMETLWHKKFVGSIYVNDQEFIVSNYIDYNNMTFWFNHYSHQAVSLEFDVDKNPNDIYEIVFDVDINETQHIGNFLWSADPADEYRRAKDQNGNFFKDGDDNWVYEHDENGNLIPGDDYVGNSKMQLVAVEYTIDGITHTCNLDTGICNTIEYDEHGDPTGVGCAIEEEGCAENAVPWVEFETASGAENFEQGSLVLPVGARVTMRVIPDRGYQVMNINMAELTTTDEGIGEFTFTVPAGAAYFVADVVEVEDKVEAESEAVESGSITIGDDEDSLDYGTAKLEIKDVDLNDEDIEGFEGAADGYNVSTYLDISLFKTLYKGIETDTWDEQIDELDGEATITLKLEEGVDGNEVVIVHQKHDGTYEVIPTTYDPATHTITFKTSSFSNYAIASRTVESPDTGTITMLESSSVTATITGVTMISIVIASFGTLLVTKRIRE